MADRLDTLTGNTLDQSLNLSGTSAASVPSSFATGGTTQAGGTSTPYPVYIPGQNWTSSIPGSWSYYVDPWHNLHAGMGMDASGNPASGYTAPYLWFPDITSERNGTADLQYAWNPNDAWVTQNVKPTTYNGQSGWTVPTSEAGNIQANMSQTGRNNSKYASTSGGIGGLIGSLLSVASFIPGMQFLAPFAAGYNVVDGLAEGNLGQALGGALGLTGIPAGVTDTVSQTLGVSANTANAIVAAAAGGSVAGLTGGNVIAAALISGGLQYASPEIQKVLSDMGITNQQQLVDAGNNLSPADLEQSSIGPATGSGTAGTNSTTGTGAGSGGGLEEVVVTAPRATTTDTGSNAGGLIGAAGLGLGAAALANSGAGGAVNGQNGATGTGTGSGGSTAAGGALGGIASALGLSTGDLVKLLAAGGGLLTGFGTSQAASSAANPLYNLSQTQTNLANDLLAKYQSGNISAADAYSIDQWEKQQTAATRQYYSSAGIPDSSMATEAIGNVSAQAVAMRSTALNNMLKDAISALSGAASTTQQAVQQAVQADNNLSNAYQSFFSNLARLGTVTDTQGGATTTSGGTTNG